MPRERKKRPFRPARPKKPPVRPPGKVKRVLPRPLPPGVKMWKEDPPYGPKPKAKPVPKLARRPKKRPKGPATPKRKVRRERV